MGTKNSLTRDRIHTETVGMDAKSIMRLCEIFATERGLTLSTVSTYAAAAGDFYARLKRGHDLTTRRAARVIQWMAYPFASGHTRC